MNLQLRPVALVAALLVLSTSAFSQGQPEEKVTPVFGQTIHYFESGQGPALILLHGLGGSKEMWMGNLGALSAKYHVYAIDQIGFGHSDKPLLDYRIATFSDFLYGFMQSQHVSKASLVANSLGGWIALDFAIQHPEMVDRLVLVDSAGITWQEPANLNPASVTGMRSMLEAILYDKKSVTDALAQQVLTNRMKTNDGYTIQRTIAGFSAENQFEDAKLASMHAPTLVVWGREDGLLPLSYGEKLRDSIPGAKMVVFDQCGHVPQIEQTEEFNQTVLDFMSKHSGSTE